MGMDQTSNEDRTIVKDSLCFICKESEHKYKCPKCAIRYCSVNCFKQHKSEACHEQESKEPGPHITGHIVPTTPTVLEEGELSEEDVVTEDKVALEQLQQLGESKELVDILQNPHLRRMMLNLKSSSDPAKDIEAAMQEPIFTEFADECLKVVEPHD